MSQAMLAVAIVCLAHAGFVALCMAMERHARDLGRRGHDAPWRGRLRGAGALLLGLSLVLAIRHSGWGQGPLLWLGALSVSALVLVFGLLPYRPRATMPSAWCAFCSGIAAMTAGALL